MIGPSLVLTSMADNTNPDPDTRGQWVELAKKNKVPIRCIWFRTPVSICEHNDAVRALNKTVSLNSALFVNCTY